MEINTTAKINDAILQLLGKPLEEAKIECKKLAHTKVCRNKSFKGKKSLIYFCQTCSLTKNSCICAECFQAGNHENHDYIVKESDGFTCDCGDEKYWKPSGFCKNHGMKVSGNIIELLPPFYVESPQRLENFFINYIQAIRNSDELDIYLHSKVLLELCSVDFFFLLLAEVLSREIPSSMDSHLRDYLSYPKVTYFQLFYELYFLKNQLNLLNDFLTEFNTDMDLLRFDYSTIYDLSIVAINLQISIKYPLASTFRFRGCRDIIIKDFFFSERLHNFLCVAKPIFKEYLKSGIETPQLKNLNKFIWSFYSYAPQEVQTYNFKGEWLHELINIFSLASNIEGVIIKTGEHEVYDNRIIQDKLRFLNGLLLVMRRTIDMVSVNVYHHFLPKIHECVMRHVKNYLSEVPIITICGKNIHYRISGVNQAVSPFSLILPFYTEILVNCEAANLPIVISEEDAQLLFEACCLSLRFKQQFVDGKFKRNNNGPFVFYFYYVSLFTYNTLLSDLTLPQIISRHLDTQTLLLQWAVMFDLFPLENDKIDYDLSDLTSSPYDILGFLRSILEVSRRFEVVNHLDEKSIFEQFIIHLTAAGISSPAVISKSTPFSYLPLVDIYDGVCERKGVLTEEASLKVDPIFPLLREHREALFASTLLPQKPFRRNRYDTNIDCQIPIIFSNQFFVQLIKECCETGCKEIGPYVLMCLMKIKNVDCDEYLERIGSYIANCKNDLIDAELCVKDIGGVIYDSYEQIVQELNDKQSKIKSGVVNKKEAMMRKFQKMQKQYAVDIDVESEDIDDCIVCQMKSESVIGNMISINDNIAVSGGNLTVSGCMHTIHYDCCTKLQKKKCPLCKSTFTHFLPQQSDITIEKIDTITNILVEFFSLSDDGSIITSIANCISSTLLSISAAKIVEYVVTTDDINIIKTLYHILTLYCGIDSFYLETINEKTPFEIRYILSLAYNISSNSLFQFIEQNIASHILLLSKKKSIPIDQCISQTLTTYVNPFNSFLELFHKCIFNSELNNSLSIDSIGLLVHQNSLKLPQIILPQPVVIPPKFHLPNTFQEVMEEISTKPCSVCGEKPTEYKECSVCLFCKAFICDNRACFTKHSPLCSTKEFLYLYLKNGRVCDTRLGSSVTAILYYSKYRDPYDFDNHRKCPYYLDEQHLNSFIKSYLRGDLFSKGTYANN
ncbi:E3 ubiquitin-protein ligase [Entamoeba marina]